MRRVLALLLALCLVLTACEGDPEPSPSPSPEPSPAPTPVETAQPLPFALAYDPAASLHPLTGDSEVNLELTGLVYQRLYQLDNSFEPQPVLVQSAAVSGDGLTWTFRLKPGTVFSDGTPLTAAHAAASLNAARTSPLYLSRLSGITGVTGQDDSLSVTLAQPNGALPALLDIPVVLEQEEGPPLGSGCYRYASAGPDLILERSPVYGGDLPYESIPLIPVTGPEQRVSSFDSGAVAAVTTDFTASYALGYSANYELTDYPTTDLLYVGFRASGGPCQSPLIRRALSLAFDRESLCAAQLAGHALASALPISPLHRDYSAAAARSLAYDPDSAAALLTQAGCALSEEDGLLHWGREPLALTLLVNSDSSAKQAVANCLASSLSSLGVTVTVRKLAWDSYTAALAAGEFDLYIGEVLLPGDFDPSALLTGALNYGAYQSEEFSQALSAWRASSGSVRTQAARQLWTLFAQEAPIAPLCFKERSMLVRWGTVTGLNPIRADPFYQIELWQSIS